MPATIPRRDALVEQLEQRIAQLEQRLVALEAARASRRAARRRRGDAAVLARLVPALRALIGSAEFAACDLAETRDVTVRAALGTSSPKTIGRLLTRADGVEIDGCVIVACGDERGARLYRLEGVSAGF